MSVIKVGGLVKVNKLKAIRRWVGFWLLRDMPKAKVIIRKGNFIMDANTIGVEIKNANPFVETTISDCNFYPDNYKVVRLIKKKTLWQKIKDKVLRR